MQLKKRWTCLILLFALLPVTAYSQTRLYELQQGKMAAGLGLSRGQNSIGIGGGFSYGVNSRTKIALLGCVYI